MRRKSNTPFFRVITQWSRSISGVSPPVPDYTKSEIDKVSFVIDSCGPAENRSFCPQIRACHKRVRRGCYECIFCMQRIHRVAGMLAHERKHAASSEEGASSRLPGRFLSCRLGVHLRPWIPRAAYTESVFRSLEDAPPYAAYQVQELNPRIFCAV
jgi:hypothetical protein